MHIFTENSGVEKVKRALFQEGIVSMRGFSSTVEKTLRTIVDELNKAYPARYAMKMVKGSTIPQLGYIWDVEKYQANRVESIVKENYHHQRLKKISL